MIRVVRGSERNFENIGGDAGTVRVGRDVSTDISGTLGAGVVVFEKCAFDETPAYDDYRYCIEGGLTVKAAGEAFALGPGDGIWVPRGTPVGYVAEARATLFDAHYPVDWRDRAHSNGAAPAAGGDGPVRRAGVALMPESGRAYDDFTGDGSALIGRDVGAELSRDMGTNLAVFENCNLEWTTRYDEYLYCLEGNLTIRTETDSPTLEPGDSIWIPDGTWMVYEAAAKAVAAVAVYPVDWRQRTGFTGLAKANPAG